MRQTKLSPGKRLILAKELWGWEPHATQREWLLDRHKVKVAACGRRWGKTESAAVDIATYAIANDGSVQMVVAPTYDQSKLITNTVERLLLSNAEVRRHVHVTKTPYPEIRYRESRIMARTADDDGRNLRGHSADRVVVDEAAFVRDEVVNEVIGPMLADRDGELVMISTPFGKNHFYRSFVQGASVSDVSDPSDLSDKTEARSRVRSFQFPSWVNPHISREYIEHQREILSERQFRVEYEAEFVDDQSAVFPWEDIQAAVTADAETRRHGDRGTNSERSTLNDQHSTPLVCVAGIDWARYSDYTAVVILAVSSQQPAVSHIVSLDRFNRMEWRAQVERVADLLCRHGVQAVATDQTSVGDPVLEMLKETLWRERQLNTEIEGVVFTNQLKREMMDNLAIRLAHRELTFPHNEALINELQYYEYELTESGNMRMGAKRGYHDDCVCALALALRLAPKYRYFDSFTTSGRVRDAVKGW